METTFEKTKRERFSFIGFIFLAIGFIGLLLYGNYMNKNLEEKAREIEKKQIQFQGEKEKFEIQQKANSQLKTLIPQKDSLKVNSITEISKSKIASIDTKTILEVDNNVKSVVYIQVGSVQTLDKLKKEDFLRKINGNGYSIVNAYDLQEGKANDQIRYFNIQDKALADNLSIIIKEKFPDIILTTKFIKYSKIKIPKGQLEVWIK